MSEKKDQYTRMTESPVFGLVLRLSVPTTMSMLITSIYNLADTYFVSSLGNSATSAVGVVYSIQSIIQAVGYGFGMGAQSLISRRLGEKKNSEANLYGTSAFVAAFLIGVIIMTAGISCLPPLMRVFGSTDTALPYACDYGLWILIGAPVFCSSFVLNNILRAEGKAALSMIGLCSGGLLNIALDVLFIFGLKMGITGAALATMFSQLFSFLILVSFFLRNKTFVRVNLLKTSRRFGDYIQIFRIGLPTVFRQSLGSLSTALLNIAVRPYGDAAMAAVSIANRIYMLLRGMLVGVGQGFQPVAGYNYGAKKYLRVRQAFNTAIVIGTVYCLAASSVIFSFSKQLIDLFRSGDAEVIQIGGNMLRYMSASLLVLGYSTFVNQLYQSLGFVGPATFLASCRQGIFFVPMILLLPSMIGLTGVLITQPVADILTFCVSVPFHVLLLKKHLPVHAYRRQE